MKSWNLNFLEPSGLLQACNGTALPFTETEWMCFAATYYSDTKWQIVGPSGCAVLGVGLQALACWECALESRRVHEYLSLVSVMCCHVEISASGWSLVQRSPTECGVSECDREASIMRRPWPTRVVEPLQKRKWQISVVLCIIKLLPLIVLGTVLC
jgi:hypothetical protein